MQKIHLLCLMIAVSSAYETCLFIPDESCSAKTDEWTGHVSCTIPEKSSPTAWNILWDTGCTLHIVPNPDTGVLILSLPCATNKEKVLMPGKTLEFAWGKFDLSISWAFYFPTANPPIAILLKARFSRKS